MQALNEYMQTYFPGVDLKPSVYHQWNKGLHFKLGGDIYQIMEDSDDLNMERFDYAYHQVELLFQELFAKEDEVFLVTNTYHEKANRGFKRMNVYHRNLKKKELIYQIRQQTSPYLFEEEEAADDYYTSRYVLKCQPKDLRVKQLLRAACNEDFPLKPKFGKGNMYYPDVFFVNRTKHIIFFIYDDRGCEVIANDLEVIRLLYEKYREWIAEYDQVEISKRFE